MSNAYSGFDDASTHAPMPQSSGHLMSDYFFCKQDQSEAAPGMLMGSDGNRYVRGTDGRWTHDGWLYDSAATGTLLQELEATHVQQLQQRASDAASPSDVIAAFHQRGDRTMMQRKLRGARAAA